jgi:hypothetical protein
MILICPGHLENLLELLILNHVHVQVFEVSFVPTLADPALRAVPPYITLRDLIMADISNKYQFL